MRRVGVGTRTFNFIIDTLLIFGLSEAAFQGNSFYAMYWKFSYYPFYFFFYSIMVLYYLFFESIFKRSPAKWLTSTKVITNKGGHPAFWQILVRSIIRILPLDCFFFRFYEKTLHDLLSKTEVIEV